jgi:hypothetical protein
MFISSDGKFEYYLGIIDYLQLFTFNKSVEFYYRDKFTKKYLSSCCPPEPYADRFFNFMNNEVFVNQDIELENDFYLPSLEEVTPTPNGVNNVIETDGGTVKDKFLAV